MAYEFIESTGVIVVDTSDLQTEVEDEYKSVFGDDLDLDPETPEGILISAETTSRAGISTNNAQLANQINPNIAGGVFLDALWALLGGTRSLATSSTFAVNPDLTGVPSTFIPAGSKAANSAGDEFETLGDVTLDGSGLGDVAFASVETGAIVCDIGDLTTILSGVIGWETVNNTVAATLGVATQSDISARSERKETLGAEGSGLAISVSSKVRAVSGVESLTFRENETAAPVVIDNVNLVANSIWVCVDGGTDADVASALLGAKSGGCNWNNGNSSNPVTEVVVDPTSGQSYSVLFDRPDIIPVLYEVTITSSTISNSTQIVKDAIVAYANGELDGEVGLVVGADVSPYEAAGAVNVVEPGITILLVRVTTVASGVFQLATIPIELWEQATVDSTTAVTVIVV